MRHDEMLGFLHYLLLPGDEATITWAGYWELAFWALVLLLTALLVLFRPSWLIRAEEGFRRISQHRNACVWGLAGAVVAIRTMLLPLIPIPIPAYHDEFSYLLGADTFASGRLTNPPHPMWVHFESFHINMLPTYQSMYPPAQGLVLGLGQKLTGEPWVGVLVSVAVMCAVFCWMLQGWMAPQWALLGGIFAVMRYGIFSYWINSYWGGAVAAIGGALLLGALPRLRQNLTLRHLLLFVAGLVILANSRPLEGLLFSLPFFFALLYLMARSPIPRRGMLLRLVLPSVLLLASAGAWMLYYNWRGTGHLLTMPYAINQVTYHYSRPFFFQKPFPIASYRHPEMRVFYLFHELPDVLRSHSGWGMQYLMGQKFFCYYTFMVWPLLLLFVPGLLVAARKPELRVVVAAILLMTAGLTVQIWPAHGHYAAPAAGAVLLILLSALRSLRATGRPHLQWFSRAIVLGMFLWLLVPIADRLWNPLSFGLNLTDVTSIPRQIECERLKAHLSQLPGRHLVLVHYHFGDVPSVEWIYNRADIDNSKVVLARDMGAEANQELLRYFPNRQVWYIDHSSGPVMTYASAIALYHPANGLLADAK